MTNDFVKTISATSNVEENKKEIYAAGKERKGYAQEKTLSQFELALREILVWQEEGGKSKFRISEKYRHLFACLTPRQIKFYLRERLIGDEAEDDHGGPASALLRTLFHPLWKVRRDEPDLFHALSHFATTATREMTDNSLRGKLGGPSAETFRRQLQTLASLSTILDEEAVKSCWPKKSEERALLLWLLRVSDEEEGGLVSGSSAAVVLFPAWVWEQMGERPVGFTVAEQVSAFQDMASARFRTGDKRALVAVVGYAEQFLDTHKRELDASSAATISNLAVLIDDFAGSEVQCDRLFQVAIQLARPGSRIPFYYAEFLLDVLGETSRRERLMGIYKDEQEIVNRVKAVLATIGNTNLEPKSIFYRDLLLLRLEVEENEPLEKRLARLWELVKQPGHVALLAQGDREPASRLNNALDAVIGRSSGMLPDKALLQAMIWALQLQADAAGWSMAIQIANDMVGQSSADSPIEKTGLRMNAALVGNQELLAANENARTAAIWSQTASLLSQRLGNTAATRIGLALVVSSFYGGDSQWTERARKSWDRLSRQGDGGTPEAWLALLDSGQRDLVAKMTSSPQDADLARRIAEAVFAPQYWPPLRTPEELVKTMGWDQPSFAWAEGLKFDEAVAALLAAAKSEQ